MTRSSIAIYGRTYLDAEVNVPLATLADGKGKVDTEVRAVLGGFGCNAARALAAHLPAGSVRLVTVCSRLDLARLRDAVPTEIVLDAILHDSLAWPAICVIVNPAGECRLLRGRADDDQDHWKIEHVGPETLAAELHVFGRVPTGILDGVFARRAATGRIAWCGGDAVPPVIECKLDLMCVNTVEAQRLLDTGERSPRVLAHELALRANNPGSVRLVTGRGDAPTVAAVRELAGVVLHEGAMPVRIPPTEVRRFKGVGDVFAARFVTAACFDDAGASRSSLDVARALAVASDAAAAFITDRSGS